VAHDDSNRTWQRDLQLETPLADTFRVQPVAPQVPGLTILWHPDGRRIGERVVLRRLTSGRTVEVSRLEPLFAPPAGGGSQRPLADAYVSRKPFALVPAGDGGVVIRRGDSHTRLAVDGEPLLEEHRLGLVELGRGVVLLLANRIVLLLHHLDAIAPESVPAFGLVGESSAIVYVRQQIERVAEQDVAVLIRGATGTGKELVAEAIHRASPRRTGPWVAVNMGAIPTSLATAELFGAARGAFTGATRPHRGHFGRADGGTLLLDEIGEAPIEVQVQLLRTLETGEVQPVGGNRPQPVDVRVIAATDSDLERLAEEGRFRLPLLHRLASYEITIPPLVARRDDLGRLLYFFLQQELDALDAREVLADRGRPEDAWLPAPLLARLCLLPWPGNVRQLANVARHMAINYHDQRQVRLDAELERLLEADASRSLPAVIVDTPTPMPQPRRYRKPSEVTEEELVAALRANRWQIKPTAEALGISRPSLYVLMERSPSVRKATDLSREEIESCLASCGGDLEAASEALQVSISGLKMRIKALGL